MKRETKKRLSAKDLKALGTSPDLVVRRVRSDEELLGRIHQEDIAARHEEEDLHRRAPKDEQTTKEER